MSLSVKSPNSFILQGNLNFSNASNIEKALDRALKSVKSSLEIELKDIQKIDSAGIALFMHIIHYCQSNNIALQFLGPVSENTKSLISIHGLDDLFSPFIK
ncbi:STAS domain-containing protein [Cysteiniphilum halobium]|uniref:STAS domain-containing protein n=1 Tax=Cysteiniphilum halobium TaxID=2219059 RepID=UPI000E64C781|nr:STAS domain-containing protein [Cysteiniphilum halobium]